MSKDDNDWIDLLGGKDVPDADPETREDVALLRSAIKALRTEAIGSDAPKEMDIEEGWQRLLVKADAEGLRTPARQREVPTDTSKVRPRWRLWLGGISAAVAAAIALNGVMQPALRGDAPTLEVVRPQPREWASTLAGQLRDAGAEVDIETASGGIVRLNIRVEDRHVADVEAVLNAQGLRYSRESALRIDVKP